MEGLAAYIKSYFEGLSTNDAARLLTYFKPIELKKGDYLCPIDRKCDQLAFVQHGLLRMYALQDGKEVTQWISYAGYFATDLSSFMFDTPARWRIQALTDSTVFSISKADYILLPSVLPEWHHIEKLFVMRCFAMMEDRIFSHLSASAETRYRLFFENHRELFYQVPQQYIASMLGMTPETFSRIRKKQLR
jgi:CRP-like cAMP-binding protein